MSVMCGTLSLRYNYENNAPQPHQQQCGFRHLQEQTGELTMAGIKVVETDTIQDIDEALTYLSETLKTQHNPQQFMSIVDALLDERLGKQCESL